MKHKTFRGKWVDMDALSRKNQKTVATGNMGVNANGDKLGPGGEVVESSQRRTKRHYTTTSTSKTTMSVKGDAEDTKAPIAGLETPAVEEPKKKATVKKKKPKVEVENEAGDIIMEDEHPFPEEFDEEDEK